MASVIQRSFAGGEIAPQLAGRADQAKYATGARTVRNFMVLKHGGIANRPGTEFVAEVKDSADATRLLKFVFNSDQAYALEFGDGYIRFVQNGALLTVSGVAAWSNATAYAVGDLATTAGVTYYCILAHTNHAQPNATYWYALTGSIFEVPTPYAAADLADLQYRQSGDIVTLVARGYAPRELRRLGQTQWTLVLLDTGAPLDAPVNVVATAGSPVSAGLGIPAGVTADGGDATGVADITTADQYRIAAYDDSPVRIGVASAFVGAKTAALAFSRATGALPVTVSWSAVASAQGYAIFKKRHGVGSFGLIAITAGTNWSDDDSVVVGAAVDAPIDVASGGIAFVYVVTAIDEDTGSESTASTEATCTGSTPTSSDPNVITWDAVTGAASYNVYRKVDGIYSYIGSATGTTFDDINYDPDGTRNPPSESDPFVGTGNYPSAIGYFQQRLCLASTDNDPERVRLSRTGDFRNFSISSPLQDDDAVSFIIAGDQVNEVRHLFEVGGKFFILTAGGEWTIDGDQAGTVTPTAINLRQQGYSGAAKLRPIIIDSTALYVQARGTIARDLRYDLSTDGYQGRDLTIYATHLFEAHTLIDWDYQRQPNSVVWAIREDGGLLGLTYIREHEVWGWHRHDTGDGDAFESGVCLPEGDEDALYTIVARTIGGATKRYIERLHSRTVTDVATDAFFVDCGATYDGRNLGVTTLTLSGGTTWSNQEDLTLTASAAQFIAGDIGNEYHLIVGDLTLRCRVTGYTSSTVVTVRANRDVVDAGDDAEGEPIGDYTVFRSVAISDWSRAVDEVSGLTHLEGRTVAILADGNEEPQAVVTGGAVSLSRPFAVVHVGLPITADFEALDLEDVQQETLLDKKKLVVQATLLVASSRGVFAGTDEDHLEEYMQRGQEAWDEAVRMETGPIDLRLNTTWTNHGRVFVRQTSPLPLEILALVRKGTVGGGG